MENKKFNSRVVAQIKKIYQVNEQDYNKMAKLQQKIEDATAEYEILKASTEAMEQRVMSVTGGFTSRDLIDVVVTPLFNEDGTPKMDKEGKYQQKKKQYVLKYPDTVVPPTTPETETEPAEEETETPAIEEPTL